MVLGATKDRSVAIRKTVRDWDSGQGTVTGAGEDGERRGERGRQSHNSAHIRRNYGMWLWGPQRAVRWPFRRPSGIGTVARKPSWGWGKMEGGERRGEDDPIIPPISELWDVVLGATEDG